MRTLRTWWRRAELLVAVGLFVVMVLPLSLLIAAVLWEPPHWIAYSLLEELGEIVRSEWRAAGAAGEGETP